MSTEIFRGRLDRPTLAGLGRLLDALAEAMEEAGIAGKPRHDILIAVDELVSNVLNHREGRDRPRVELLLERRDEALVRLEIVDDGREFDPFTRSTPDLSAPLEARPLGGLGIHLARSLARSASYRREGEENRTILAFAV